MQFTVIRLEKKSVLLRSCHRTPETAATSTVRMNCIGDVPKFNVGDDFDVYQEILEQFFLANEINDAQRVPIILSSSINIKVYEIIREISFPTKPKELSYEALFEVMSEQFGKQKSTLRKRIEFFDLKQNPGESINNWFVRVKSAAMTCKFGNTLYDYVKNKFLSGLRKGPVLDKMCEEDISKSIKDLLKVAILKETAMAEREVDVNRLHRQGKWSSSDKKNWDSSSQSKASKTNDKNDASKKKPADTNTGKCAA